MPAERLSIRGVRFTTEAFLEAVAKASRAPSGASPAVQARYLASYLSNSEAAAKTLLIEEPYIDRHYLEEYTGYYASTLQAPTSRTARLHLFRQDWGQDAKSSILKLVAESGAREAGDILSADYLGFVVVRPLPSAPIGRTVLRPYSAPEKRRRFEPASTLHDIHLLGLTLRVPGVPFQQQDQGVGACATTAVWSALARVTRADGNRAVTPLAVTMAATRNLALGRAFPASKGLERSQLLEAIRHLGYSPDVFDPYSDSITFQLALKCYVRSGIPVILNLSNKEWRENHAVTVVGYRESDSESDAAEIDYRQPGVSYGLRASGISRLYVHDDRFGPYARMTWEPRSELNPSGAANSAELPRLIFQPYEAGYDEFRTPVAVHEAYAPLYPKLRMSATDLVLFASQLLPLVRCLASHAQRSELAVEIFFVLGGHYLREAHGLGLSPERIEGLVSTLLLPRYVGVIRFAVGSKHFVDILCDPTDIPRTPPAWAPVLAFVPADPDSRASFSKFAAENGDAVVV